MSSPVEEVDSLSVLMVFCLNLDVSVNSVNVKEFKLPGENKLKNDNKRVSSLDSKELSGD